MESLAQQPDEGIPCFGCTFEGYSDCPHRSGLYKKWDFFDCEYHNCIYVIEEVKGDE